MTVCGQQAPAYPGSGVQAFDDNAEGQGEAEPAMWSQKEQKKRAESQNFRSPAGFQGNFLIGGHLKISEGGHGVSVKKSEFSD